ncbi:restriction endonuclease subunit S [Marine Group I thaumarchaeote]|uniref:Restriction endonuclease subunit S n=1 Tax=Marine Group I thaumarchaeote TaxID=2511932 RepID=A0A7K4MTZ5_9ARCH|nr:restriction endonuclease subunit S [Marine Group I thaumarchaeote]NWK00296.1 restriction endonuclease subunit S [Marine Group I thaumarchaeote]NWK13419.1 restriction endonuclease subunit S [Marine Group I thaumarchaeote]
MKKAKPGYKLVKWLFRKEIEIPEDWVVKKIDELFELLLTGTNSRSDLDKKSDIHYIHYGDIHTKWNKFILDCSFQEIPMIRKDKVEKLPLLKEGDLIVADVSEDYDGSGASILIKNIKNKKIVSGLHTFALRNNDETISLNFRRYITSMRFVKTQIISFITGVSVYGLSKNNFKKIRICLPPLKQQQKIASILSNVDDLISFYDNSIESTQKLKKGLMQTLLTRGIGHKKFKKVKWLFGKEIEIPEEWNIKKLFDLCENKNDIVAGPFGSNLLVDDYIEKGTPIIRLQNIHRNNFINKNIKFISNLKADELKYHSYIPGDIILAKLGDPIGKTCIVPDDFSPGIVVADVVRIRTSSKKADKIFVEYVLNSDACKKQHNMEKIGTTRPRVNLAQIRKLIFPCPSVDEQKNISDILMKIDLKIDESESKKSNLEKIKKGLMQKLLTGQIRVTA